MSTLAELFDSIRHYYLSRFTMELRNIESEPGVRVIVEPALLNEDGRIVSDGPLDSPMRHDIAVIEHDKAARMIQIDTEKLLAFEPVRIKWNDEVDVEIEPFQWNYVRVILRPARPLSALAPLKRWFDQWFEEPESPRDPPFFGVVHFMSDPDVTDDSVAFWIDLGSAPTDAMEDLLDACALANAESVFLGTTS